MNNKEIQTTKPLLPPLAELMPYLEQIWDSDILTNGGEVHAKFEQALCKHLGTEYISLVSNGTLALILALKALKLNGEVITTPFTHISTIQAIYWNNLKPVFVDINEADFNIDVSAIEKAITPNTTAILPVHVFGNPCKVDEIDKIAKKYNLKVIYDAAHCFGVELNNNSVLNYGDISIISFHATKVFNCIEGGAIICRDRAMKVYLDALKNSGIDSDFQSVGYGFNAKLNEIQAAYGLVQLNHVNKAIEHRQIIARKYRELFINFEAVFLIDEQERINYNYSYFPIIINSNKFGKSRDQIVDYLKENKINTKKYFYPLVSDFKEFNRFKKTALPVAEQVANNIICLPLSHKIQIYEVGLIVNLLKKLYNKQFASYN